MKSKRMGWASYVARTGRGEATQGFGWEAWEEDTSLETQGYIGEE